MMFEACDTPPLSLPCNENHLAFKWMSNKCNIIFSVSRVGDAASIHFFSDKNGLRSLKRAINDFCHFVFYLFDWCTMIIAMIEMPSVCRLAEKLNFSIVKKDSFGSVYMRSKDGFC